MQIPHEFIKILRKNVADKIYFQWKSFWSKSRTGNSCLHKRARSGPLIGVTRNHIARCVITFQELISKANTKMDACVSSSALGIERENMSCLIQSNCAVWKQRQFMSAAPGWTIVPTSARGLDCLLYANQINFDIYDSGKLVRFVFCPDCSCTWRVIVPPWQVVKGCCCCCCSTPKGGTRRDGEWLAQWICIMQSWQQCNSVH